MRLRPTPTTAGAITAGLVLSLTAIAAPSVSGSPAQDTAEAPPPASEPSWTPCFEERTAETGTFFECTRLEVPLDYDEASDGTIELDLVRIPAADPEQRTGSILLNPGGPGGSGVEFAVGFGPFVGVALGEDVAAQFDIVGFDPRGVNNSTPIRCFDTFDEALASGPSVPFPLDFEEELDIRRSNLTLALSCFFDREARRLGPHLSTANVARDMDRIRAALGDEQMNFLGLSYGTFLGATYANLFPDRVRSVVVDGVLDPVAWVNSEREVPFSTRLRSDEGAQETLEEFFAQCEAAAPGNCALAPNASARFSAVADGLLEDPVTVIDPATGVEFTIRYQDFIGGSLGALYSPTAYPFLAADIAVLESIQAGEPAPAPTSPLALAGSSFSGATDREQYPNVVEAFPAVACVDTRNPFSYRVWRQEGIAADEEFGFYGRIWTWASSPCARWPFRDRDRFAGPFDTDTANPVLVIGNLYDPATRYEGAQALRSILPNSALLTVDVPGHTSLGLSGCAGFLTGRYLIDPAAADRIDGTVCPAEFNAFDQFSGPPPPAPEPSPAPESRTEDPTAESMDTGDIRDVRDAVDPHISAPAPWLD